MSALSRLLSRLRPRSYSAARQPVGREPWYPARSGPNAAVGGAGATIAARARDAVRNNAYAARIVDLWVANLVGTGIVTRWPGSPAVAGVWGSWTASRECDAEGGLDWAGLQVLAVRAMIESGEALVWMRKGRVTAANPLGLSLKVLEGDRLDWSYTSWHSGRRVVQGIEVDDDGRPVAYHLRRDPDAWLLAAAAQDRVRVPASEIIHLYRRRRPEQLRDVSWLAPVLWSLRDLTEYDTALLRKAYVEACLALIVVDDEESTVTGATDLRTQGRLEDADGRRVESLEPQMILYRRGGAQVTTVNPTSSGAHAGYAKRALEGASVGTGLTYDQVAGDLSQANYSSLRAGKIEFRRLLEQVQYTLVVPVLNQRVAEWFHRRAVELRLWSDPMPKVRHVPPSPEMIDPLKDGSALLLLARAGFLAPQEIAGMFGSDLETVLEDIAAANKLADSLGVVRDSDPRKVSKAGTSQADGFATDPEPPE